MSIKTKGLVLRVTNSKESDRVLTILTPTGIVNAYAKAARNIKNKKFAATDRFCFSDFVLYEGKDLYIVDEASENEVFFGLRNDVERLSLAQYFADVLIAVCPETGDVSDIFRLSLNTFFFLSEGKKDIELIKAVFELKSMCFSGFMPNLVACAECAVFEDEMLFDMANGLIYCSECFSLAPYGSKKLNRSMLAIMRHIAFSDMEKLFSFKASKENIKAVSMITEKYLEIKTERSFKSLEFYYSVKV